MEDRWSFALGLSLGAALGTAIGLLLARESGETTRDRLRSHVADLADQGLARIGALTNAVSSPDSVRRAVDDLSKVAEDVKARVQLGIASSIER